MTAQVLRKIPGRRRLVDDVLPTESLPSYMLTMPRRAWQSPTEREKRGVPPERSTAGIPSRAGDHLYYRDGRIERA